jgi:hypothetical protein
LFIFVKSFYQSPEKTGHTPTFSEKTGHKFSPKNSSKSPPKTTKYLSKMQKEEAM